MWECALWERAPPAKGWLIATRQRLPRRIPETLFVLPLERPLGSCRSLRDLSRAGPARTTSRPFAGGARSHNFATFRGRGPLLQVPPPQAGEAD